LTILGGVALTLYGVQQVRESVTQGLGPQLRLLIEKSTHNRLKAFAAGIVVTGLIQSASATSLIVTGFAARHLISVLAALAVMLGADVGTAIVAQVFSLGFHGLGPILVFVGMVTAAWFPIGKYKYIGSVMVGLGVMLVGLGIITHTAEPMQKSDNLRTLMAALSGDLMMTFLLGALITWLAQSSLSVVLLIMSFAGVGIMDPETAFALVLGTHVGATITPMILNARQKNDARPVAFGSFLMRLMFCLAVLPLLAIFPDKASLLGATPGRQVVNFHMVFSLARALLFLPLLSPIAKGLVKLFPWTRDENDPSLARYLDNRDLVVPTVALATAERETLRLGDLVLSMLEEVKTIFERHDRDRLEKLFNRDNHVDRLYDQIKLYMTQLSREVMTAEQAKRHLELLMFVINLEHIGDIIVKNLCELANKKWRDNLSFSKQGWEEIERYHKHVCDNFRLALTVFQSRDPLLARDLVRHKEALQLETANTAGSHFERLRQGLMESLRSSSLHLDIIRDLRRINDYLTSVAYGILEAHGALQSRIKE
jgi:phosphate:Na+ symporter